MGERKLEAEWVVIRSRDSLIVATGLTEEEARLFVERRLLANDKVRAIEVRE